MTVFFFVHNTEDTQWNCPVLPAHSVLPPGHVSYPPVAPYTVRMGLSREPLVTWSLDMVRIIVHSNARRGAQRRKPIVNPFVPQKVHQNVTANKRKWMHVFPRNRDGHAFQPHHDISTNKLKWITSTILTTSVESDVLNRDTEDSPSSLLDKKPQTSRLFGKVRSSEGGCQPIVAENFAMTRRMGTDWESVVMPACLPITTDYFPSQKELEQKFSEYNYYLSHENSMDTSENGDDNQAISPWSSPRKHMKPIESLREVISQRILLVRIIVFVCVCNYRELCWICNSFQGISISTG